MKTTNTMKVYLLPQFTLRPQWDSLLGDKYARALPFPWEFTDSIEDAQVIAWDGLVSPKGRPYYETAVSLLKEGKKVLLLQREAFNLFKAAPFLEEVATTDWPSVVELVGGNILPEDLLAALETCHGKLNHV